MHFCQRGTHMEGQRARNGLENDVKNAEARWEKKRRRPEEKKARPGWPRAFTREGWPRAFTREGWPRAPSLHA